MPPLPEAACRIRRLGSRCLFAWEPSADALTPYRGEGAGTLTRNSIATYKTGSTPPIAQVSANAARYQDGGILLEPQRTNYAPDSDNFGAGGSPWSTTRCSLSDNTDTAPDGTLTAGRLIEDSTATETHFAVHNPNTTVPSGTVFTYSVFAKAGTGSGWINLTLVDSILVSPYGLAHFDLVNGATGATLTAGASVTHSIESIGDGWYRCVMTVTFSVATTSLQMRLQLNDANNSRTFTGDGSSYEVFWGYQLEAGSYPTSYIPTSGTSVTREADALTLPYAAGLPADAITVLMRGQFKTTPTNEQAGVTIGVSGSTTDADEYKIAFEADGVAQFYTASGGAAVEATGGPTFALDTQDDIIAQIDVANDTIRTFNGSDVAQSTAAIAATATHVAADDVVSRTSTGLPFVLDSLLIVRGLLTPSQMRSLLRA